jgi:hypothetical protein
VSRLKHCGKMFFVLAVAQVDSFVFEIAPPGGLSFAYNPVSQGIFFQQSIGQLFTSNPE